MRLCLLLLLVGFFFPKEAKAQLVIAPPPHPWFMLDVDAGIHIPLSEEEDVAFMMRLRGGPSLVANLRFLSGLLTVETQGFDNLNIGLMGDLIWLRSGLEAYLGASLSTERDVRLTAGAGWSVLFVEIQRETQQNETSLQALVQIPIGVLLYGRYGQPKGTITVPLPAAPLPASPFPKAPTSAPESQPTSTSAPSN